MNKFGNRERQRMIKKIIVIIFSLIKWSQQKLKSSFPGGTVVKNAPANAGDTKDSV